MRVSSGTAPITSDSVCKTLPHCKHNSHASKGCHAGGSPCDLRVKVRWHMLARAAAKLA